MSGSSGETSLSDDDGFRRQGGVASCQTDMIAELMAALFFPPLAQRLLIFLLSDVDVFFFFLFFFLFSSLAETPSEDNKRQTLYLESAAGSARQSHKYSVFNELTVIAHK